MLALDGLLADRLKWRKGAEKTGLRCPTVSGDEMARLQHLRGLRIRHLPSMASFALRRSHFAIALLIIL